MNICERAALYYLRNYFVILNSICSNLYMNEHGYRICDMNFKHSKKHYCPELN